MESQGGFKISCDSPKKTAIRPIIHGKNGTAGFVLGFGLVGIMIVGTLSHLPSGL